MYLLDTARYIAHDAGNLAPKCRADLPVEELRAEADSMPTNFALCDRCGKPAAAPAAPKMKPNGTPVAKPKDETKADKQLRQDREREAQALEIIRLARAAGTVEDLDEVLGDR